MIVKLIFFTNLSSIYCYDYTSSHLMSVNYLSSDLTETFTTIIQSGYQFPIFQMRQLKLGQHESTAPNPIAAKWQRSDLNPHVLLSPLMHSSPNIKILCNENIKILSHYICTIFELSYRNLNGI